VPRVNPKLVVANWKMNPESIREARELLQPVKRILRTLKKVEAVVCPPALFLEELARRQVVSRLHFGGQDAFWERASGAFTGQLSPAMFKKAGAEYLILGHSETRQLGMTDVLINRKLKAALAAELKVILCVGEQERDEHGAYFKLIQNQLTEALKNIPRKFFARLIVAYEPLWALSTHGRGPDTPQDFLEQAIFIRKIISTYVGSHLAVRTPVLYGGSVDHKNAAGFLTAGEADGLLVGRASLRPDYFVQILKIAAVSYGYQV
jgi:triosephosphate isomerase